MIYGILVCRLARGVLVSRISSVHSGTGHRRNRVRLRLRQGPRSPDRILDICGRHVLFLCAFAYRQPGRIAAGNTQRSDRRDGVCVFTLPHRFVVVGDRVPHCMGLDTIVPLRRSRFRGDGSRAFTERCPGRTAASFRRRCGAGGQHLCDPYAAAGRAGDSSDLAAPRFRNCLTRRARELLAW